MARPDERSGFEVHAEHDPPRTTETPLRSARIAVALSGGGSRAIAFHLGCLRALNDHGILERAETLSTVSGGSVIGAMYAARSGSFETFEADARRLLSEGLSGPTKRAFARHELVGAVMSTTGLVIANAFTAVIRIGGRLFAAAGKESLAEPEPLVARRHSRTTALARVLDTTWFGGRMLAGLPPRGPRLVINACELTEGSAFYFSAEASGSWRLGRLADNTVRLADAVAASAAYPVALPALDRTFVFIDKKGERRTRRVSLTDGGVYDNTALAPLWPERDASVSIDVPTPEIVIACRAGYGLQAEPLGHFMHSRMIRVVKVALARAENASVQRLFRTQASGGFEAVALSYLGQNDATLACAPHDLIGRDEVFGYPTDFAPMPELMIEKITRRGEQLTLAVLREHIPDLLSSAARSSSVRQAQTHVT